MAGTTNYFGISYPTSTDYVKDGASAIQTVATGFDSAVAIPIYNAQTGATYTFALTDIGKTVTASNASAQTYTIPPTASVTWPTNATLYVINLGAGVVTFAAGSGVTVTNTGQTLAQYQSARLVRTALNAWTITPDSGSSSASTLISTTTIGTAVSSVTVSGAFSTTYENYKILISGGASSASNSYLKFKLGAATTAYYGNLIWAGFSSTTPASTGTNNGSEWQFAASSDTTGINGIIELNSPFLSKRTMIQAPIFWADAGTNYNGNFVGVLLDSVSYTAFTLTPATGTLTGGTIRVYGYNS